MLLASLALAPTAAFVAAGVLGALGATFHQHLKPRTAAHRTRPTHTMVLAATDDCDPRMTGVFAPDDEDVNDAPDDMQRFLEAWTDRPRSAWRALGRRELRTLRSEDTAGARAAAQGILAGVIARHVPLFDAWQVLDFAETAWSMAPEDGARLTPVEARVARHAVENAALALLARNWLPAADFRSLIRAATP